MHHSRTRARRDSLAEEPPIARFLRARGGQGVAYAAGAYARLSQLEQTRNAGCVGSRSHVQEQKTMATRNHSVFGTLLLHFLV